MRQVLLAVNPRKAAGSDGVPGKVLRVCAHQLTPIFNRIFNLSLALTPVIMKCFERLVLRHIKAYFPPPSTLISSHIG